MNDEMAMKQRGGAKGKTRCWENVERFCIYFSLYNTVDTFIHHSFINIRWGPSPCLHSCRLSGRNLHGVPSRDLNSGLPHSKPACYQLSHAAPSATLHPERWTFLIYMFLHQQWKQCLEFTLTKLREICKYLAGACNSNSHPRGLHYLTFVCKTKQGKSMQRGESS